MSTDALLNLTNRVELLKARLADYQKNNDDNNNAFFLMTMAVVIFCKKSGKNKFCLTKNFSSHAMWLCIPRGWCCSEQKLYKYFAQKFG